MNESTRAAFRLALLGVFTVLIFVVQSILSRVWSISFAGLDYFAMFAPTLLWFAGFLYSFVTIPLARGMNHAGALSLNLVLLGGWIVFLGWYLDTN